MNSDHTPAIINPWQFSSQHISKSLQRLPRSSPRDNIHHVQQRDSGLQRAPQFNTVQLYTKLRYIIQTCNIVRVTRNQSMMNRRKETNKLQLTPHSKKKQRTINRTHSMVRQEIYFKHDKEHTISNTHFSVQSAMTATC